MYKGKKILVSNHFNFSDNLSEKASRDEKKKKSQLIFVLIICYEILIFL